MSDKNNIKDAEKLENESDVSCQVPGRISRLLGQSPHRAVREQLTHTVPQA